MSQHNDAPDIIAFTFAAHAAVALGLFTLAGFYSACRDLPKQRFGRRKLFVQVADLRTYAGDAITNRAVALAGKRVRS